MKKIIAVLLLLSTLTVPLASCSSSNGGSESEAQAATDAQTGETTEAESTETDRSGYKDSLPELNYDGQTVVIYSRNTDPYSYEMGTDEMNGDVVNDAIYSRNSAVEERLNVGITVNRVDEVLSSAQKLANAGDPSCDIAAGYGIKIPTMATSHLLVNMLDLDYLDFSQPWWPEALNSQLVYYDKLYVASGDVALTMIQYLCAVFYNKALSETYGITEDFSAAVTNGSWTLDMMCKYAADVSSDVDGNSAYDQNDVYGFLQCDSVCIFAFGVGCGLKIIDRDSNGDPYIAMDTPNTYSIIEKVNALFYGTSSSFTAYLPEMIAAAKDENAKIALGNRMFANDQALFYVNQLYYMEYLRDMDSDFGILPYPKFDEAQENYVSNVRDSYTILGIPVSCSDPDRAAAVMEALAAESYRTVTPVYYEMALKEKYARDSSTSEMLDVISSSVAFDFGVVNIASLNYVSHNFQWSIEDPTKEFASNFAKNSPAAEKLLEKLVEAYKEG